MMEPNLSSMLIWLLIWQAIDTKVLRSTCSQSSLCMPPGCTCCLRLGGIIVLQMIMTPHACEMRSIIWHLAKAAVATMVTMSQLLPAH